MHVNGAKAITADSDGVIFIVVLVLCFSLYKYTQNYLLCKIF